MHASSKGVGIILDEAISDLNADRRHNHAGSHTGDLIPPRPCSIAEHDAVDQRNSAPAAESGINAASVLGTVVVYGTVSQDYMTIAPVVKTASILTVTS